MRKIYLMALVAALCFLGGCKSFRWRSDTYYRQLAVSSFVAAQLAEDDQSALDALKLAVEADPELSTAHAAIGDIYQRRNDIDKAVEAYEKSVSVNAWNFRNHYNCGFLHQILADKPLPANEVTRHLARSVELYDRAIKLYSRDYDAHLNLGVCCFLLQRYDRAEQSYKKAMEIKPKQPEAYANLGLLYDAADKLFDATEMYNRSLELNDSQSQVLKNLAAIQARSGKIETAMTNYMRACKLKPDDPAIHERLGFCSFQLGSTDDALKYYRHAIELKPSLAIAHRGLGVVLMSQFLQDKSDSAARDEALKHWQKSLDIQPEQEDLRELLKKYSPQE